MIVIDTLIRSYGVRSYLYMHPGNIAEDVGPGAKPHRARQGYAAGLVGEHRKSMLGAKEEGATHYRVGPIIRLVVLFNNNQHIAC